MERLQERLALREGIRPLHLLLPRPFEEAECGDGCPLAFNMVY
jgi:hypothetical protein